MDGFPNAVSGIPVISFETIGSTNAEALARAGAGEQGPVWFVAERQSAGRGRRGRPWVSEPGNLHVSLLISDPAPPAASAGICFVAALALHDAVIEAAHGLAPARLKLKWPNDLLLDGDKVAGILVEGTSRPPGGLALAIGFGVNCKHSPALTDYSSSDFARAGFSVSPIYLLTMLGNSMRHRLDEWDRGAGFAAIRAAWLARASGLGGAIEVRLADRSLSGTFEAIDAAGGLVLQRADGNRETITAGDIFPITG
jgi:BirA family biotin operon repressor/biotin-[acetyl-CoA-carboxylase] ligase